MTSYLATFEAENNLPLSVVADIATGRYEAFELLVASDAQGRDRAALVWTQPFNLLLSFGDDVRARLELLAALTYGGVLPPGVTGPEPASEIATRWLANRGRCNWKRTMRQGVYRLSAVTPGQRAEGAVREARPEETDVIVPWLDDFRSEADENLRSGAEMWQLFNESDSRRLWVWEVDGLPVSLAGVGGRTPRGRRIGPVYTPPEHRRRGYAEALVARVSQDLLDNGAEFCFLYTDLDNATSNSVYQKIGYEMIVESGEYVFEPWDMDALATSLSQYAAQRKRAGSERV